LQPWSELQRTLDAVERLKNQAEDKPRPSFDREKTFSIRNLCRFIKEQLTLICKISWLTLSTLPPLSRLTKRPNLRLRP